MSKKKKNPFWNSDHRSFSKFAVIATALFLLYVTFNRNGLLNWVRASIELRSQRKQIERYQDEISRMDREIKLLTTDRDSLEKFAREDFGFAAPDEDVYTVR